jgi:hypothetical protein
MENRFLEPVTDTKTIPCCSADFPNTMYTNYLLPTIRKNGRQDKHDYLKMSCQLLKITVSLKVAMTALAENKDRYLCISFSVS